MEPEEDNARIAKLEAHAESIMHCADLLADKYDPALEKHFIELCAQPAYFSQDKDVLAVFVTLCKSRRDHAWRQFLNGVAKHDLERDPLKFFASGMLAGQNITLFNELRCILEPAQQPVFLMDVMCHAARMDDDKLLRHCMCTCRGIEKPATAAALITLQRHGPQAVIDLYFNTYLHPHWFFSNAAKQLTEEDINVFPYNNSNIFEDLRAIYLATDAHKQHRLPHSYIKAHALGAREVYEHSQREKIDPDTIQTMTLHKINTFYGSLEQDLKDVAARRIVDAKMTALKKKPHVFKLGK